MIAFKTSLWLLFLLLVNVAVHLPAEDPSDVCILAVPTYGKEAVLLDGNGKLVKVWRGEHTNAGGARILPDGALLHLISMPPERPFISGGVTGGGVEILNPDGSVRWQFWNSVTHHMAFGDAIMLPNGNVLTPILEWKTKEEAMAAGRDEKTLSDRGLLVPGLMEVTPSGKNAGVPVWRWSLWNHVFQSRHPALPNYSFPKPIEGCIDIDSVATSSRLWLSPFRIEFDAINNLVLLSVRELGEVWVIDHSTSTEIATKDEGGKHGRGGRILQRIGSRAGTGQFVVSSYVDTVDAQAHTLNLLRADGSLAVASLNQDDSVTFTVAENEGVRRFSSGNVLPRDAHEAIFLPDGEAVVSSHYKGLITRISSDGKSSWNYENAMGKVKLRRGKPGDGQSCCGGKTPPDASKPSVAPATFEAAPIGMLRPYSTTYVRPLLTDSTSSHR
jgi:hypothetical protein